MAQYSKLDGYVFDKQVNQGWGLTLQMSGKAPAVAKRIFDTYQHAYDYANDVNDTAVEGLILSVVADTDAALNGVYYIKQIGVAAVEADAENGIEAKDAVSAKLVKLSSSQNNSNENIDGSIQFIYKTEEDNKGIFFRNESQELIKIISLDNDEETIVIDGGTF